MEIEFRKRFPNFDFSELNNSVIIDLGANRGDFSDWALKQGAYVIAIEPDKKAFIYLVKRLGNKENFFPINAAVADTTGIKKLYYHINRSSDPLGHSISSSLHSSKINVDQNKYEEVLVLNLLENLFEMKIKLLKIDIEGGEIFIWEILKSKYKNIELLLMETHEVSGSEFRATASDFILKEKLDQNWKLDWI
jgi:FkbM family methyltransferase